MLNIQRITRAFMFRGYSIALLVESSTYKVLDFDVDNVPQEKYEDVLYYLRNHPEFNRRYLEYVNGLSKYDIVDLLSY